MRRLLLFSAACLSFVHASAQLSAPAIEVESDGVTFTLTTSSSSYFIESVESSSFSEGTWLSIPSSGTASSNSETYSVSGISGSFDPGSNVSVVDLSAFSLTSFFLTPGTSSWSGYIVLDDDDYYNTDSLSSLSSHFPSATIVFQSQKEYTENELSDDGALSAVTYNYSLFYSVSDDVATLLGVRNDGTTQLSTLSLSDIAAGTVTLTTNVALSSALGNALTMTTSLTFDVSGDVDVSSVSSLVAPTVYVRYYLTQKNIRANTAYYAKLKSVQILSDYLYTDENGNSYVYYSSSDLTPVITSFPESNQVVLNLEDYSDYSSVRIGNYSLKATNTSLSFSTYEGSDVSLIFDSLAFYNVATSNLVLDVASNDVSGAVSLLTSALGLDSLSVFKSISLGSPDYLDYLAGVVELPQATYTSSSVTIKDGAIFAMDDDEVYCYGFSADALADGAGYVSFYFSQVINLGSDDLTFAGFKSFSDGSNSFYINKALTADGDKVPLHINFDLSLPSIDLQALANSGFKSIIFDGFYYGDVVTAVNLEDGLHDDIHDADVPFFSFSYDDVSGKNCYTFSQFSDDNGLIYSLADDGFPYVTISGYQNSSSHSLVISEASSSVTYEGLDFEVVGISSLANPTDDADVYISFLSFQSGANIYFTPSDDAADLGLSRSFVVFESSDVNESLNFAEMLSPDIVSQIGGLLVNGSELVSMFRELEVFADEPTKVNDLNAVFGDDGDASSSYDDASQALSVDISSDTNIQDLLNVLNSNTLRVSTTVVTLESDVDFSDVASSESTAIFGSSDNPFSGSFDGNGQSVSGLSGDVSLFGALADGAVVKNVSVVLDDDVVLSAPVVASVASGASVYNVAVSGGSLSAPVVTNVADSASVSGISVSDASISQPVIGTTLEGASVDSLFVSNVSYVVTDLSSLPTVDGTPVVSLLANVNSGDLSNGSFYGTVDLSAVSGDYILSLVYCNGDPDDYSREVGSISGLAAIFDVIGDESIPEDGFADDDNKALSTKGAVASAVGGGSIYKTCSCTKRAMKDVVATPLFSADKDDDSEVARKSHRIFTYDEMASGKAAYWLNFSGEGYTGVYTGKWTQIDDIPVYTGSSSNENAIAQVLCSVSHDDDVNVDTFGIVAPSYAVVGHTITVSTSVLTSDAKVHVGDVVYDLIEDELGLFSASFVAPMPDADGVIPVSLLFSADAAALPEVSVKNGLVSIFATDSLAGAHVAIYDLSGRLVSRSVISGSMASLALPTQGVYILRVANQSMRIAAL